MLWDIWAAAAHASISPEMFVDEWRSHREDTLEMGPQGHQREQQLLPGLRFMCTGATCRDAAEAGATLLGVGTTSWQEDIPTLKAKAAALRKWEF